MLHLWKTKHAAAAAEFALLIPLLLIFLLGMIDVGRLMWTWNRAEKATQMGVRYAAVTDMIPNGLATYSFAVSGGILQGEPIPTSSFASATCTSTGCTCAPSNDAELCGFSSTAFTNVVTRMQAVMPHVTAANVTVIYENSGLGFAGDPAGPDVAPLVTVQLGAPTPVNFQPLLFQFLGASLPLSGFASALTMEDGSGTASN